MTKTEEMVLQCAWSWADSPTDRDAKRSLYNAVRKDQEAVSKREGKKWAKKEGRTK